MQRITRLLVLILSILAVSQAHAQDGLVILDHVTNAASDNELIAGQTHQISIRLDARELGGVSAWIGGNGFKLYSPDGADWGYLQGEHGPVMDGGHASMLVLHHYETSDWSSADESDWFRTGSDGVDPAGGSTGMGSGVGYSYTMVDFSGIHGYIGGVTNDIVAYLEFSTNLADIGKTICFDKNLAIYSWDWASGSSTTTPIWDNGLGVDGPRCWEVSNCPGQPDTDGDGWGDGCDVCPGFDDNQDTDHDRIPDGCDSDPLFVLDSVDGLTAPGVLASGRPVQFRFRLETRFSPIAGTMNGLEFYSPDGAEWGTIVFAKVPDFAALANNAIAYAQPGWADGATPDSMVIMAGWFANPSGHEMLPINSSEVLFTVTAEFDPGQTGLTVCLDTTRSDYWWVWKQSDATIAIPQWNGPHCWTIGDKCCAGRVGDVNVTGGDEPTISDISLLIDHLFISNATLPCLAEADVNQSGGASPTEADITIGDISVLIDYLFITGPSLGLADCM